MFFLLYSNVFLRRKKPSKKAPQNTAIKKDFLKNKNEAQKYEIHIEY